MADEPASNGQTGPADKRSRRRPATIDLTATDITPQGAPVDPAPADGAAFAPEAAAAAMAPAPEAPAAAPSGANTPADAASDTMQNGVPDMAPAVMAEPAPATEAVTEPSPPVAEAVAATGPQPVAEPEPARAPEPVIMPMAPPARPSIAVPAAVAGIVGLLGGGVGATLAPRVFGPPMAPAPIVAPAPAPAQPLPPALTALPAKVDALERELGALTGRIGTLAGADTVSALAARLDAGERVLGERIGALEAALAAANRTLAQLSAQPPVAGAPASGAPVALPPAPPPVDLSPVLARIERLETGAAEALQRVEAVAGAVRAAASAAEAAGTRAEGVQQAATAGIAALDGRVAALDPKLADLAGRLEALGKRLDGSASAPLYTVVQALGAAFHRGQPYGQEIKALAALKVPATLLAPLQPFAERGAPTPAALAAEFRPLAARIATASTDTSGVWGVIGSIVQVRPTGDAAGDAPAAIVARIERALAAGNVATARATFAALPAPLQALAADFARRLTQRDAAGTALTTLERDTLAALAGPTP